MRSCDKLCVAAQSQLQLQLLHKTRLNGKWSCACVANQTQRRDQLRVSLLSLYLCLSFSGLSQFVCVIRLKCLMLTKPKSKYSSALVWFRFWLTHLMTKAKCNWLQLLLLFWPLLLLLLLHATFTRLESSSVNALIWLAKQTQMGGRARGKLTSGRRPQLHLLLWESDWNWKLRPEHLLRLMIGLNQKSLTIFWRENKSNQKSKWNVEAVGALAYNRLMNALDDNLIEWVYCLASI